MNRLDVLLVVAFLAVFLFALSFLGEPGAASGDAVIAPASLGPASLGTAPPHPDDRETARAAARENLPPMIDRGAPWDLIVLHDEPHVLSSTAARPAHFLVRNDGSRGVSVSPTEAWREQRVLEHTRVPHLDRRALSIAVEQSEDAAVREQLEGAARALIEQLREAFGISPEAVLLQGELELDSSTNREER